MCNERKSCGHFVNIVHSLEEAGEHADQSHCTTISFNQNQNLLFKNRTELKQEAAAAASHGWEMKMSGMLTVTCHQLTSKLQ